jgi:hypothetical protein
METIFQWNPAFHSGTVNLTWQVKQEKSCYMDEPNDLPYAAVSRYATVLSVVSFHSPYKKELGQWVHIASVAGNSAVESLM